MKRLFATILSVVMILSLTACKAGDNSSKDNDSGNNSISDNDSKKPINVDDYLKIKYDTSEPENTTMRDMTSLELVKEMKVGWNLGNALDSFDKLKDDKDNEIVVDESTWGNPRITKELIKAVKEAGFNVIRIPVSWLNHLSDDGKYTIDQNFLDRVHEVVNYVIDEGMYAIINIHHDGADSGDSWLTPAPKDDAEKEEMLKKYRIIWEQIAERFKNYPDYLIFESMNEFHKGYAPPTESYLELTNEINQLFVNIVRASGGNNAERHLLMPGYNTNIEYTIKGFEMPKDTIENRIIVSVHNYDPYLTALEGQYSQWGKYATDTAKVDTWGQEDYIADIYKQLKEAYIDKGIPVILGEFGATAGVEEPYRTYYTEYVVQQAVKNGVLPILWDNGSTTASSKESFGFFDRYNAKVAKTELIDAIMEAASGKDYEVVLRDFN
ncbi:MAG: glycoside hydrolase family 5 protein [Clostridiales bacterium]|nr:glycoside hydrolase family 5 protein [Clostridiales bacterium]